MVPGFAKIVRVADDEGGLIWMRSTLKNCDHEAMMFTAKEHTMNRMNAATTNKPEDVGGGTSVSVTDAEPPTGSTRADGERETEASRISN